MRESHFSRSAEKRTSTRKNERLRTKRSNNKSTGHCRIAVNHGMPPHLISRKRWREMVTMEVSASVDVGQSDGLATFDGGSPFTHCGSLPPYPPVTVAVIHRGNTCHWLLPTTYSQKRKERELNLTLSSFICALCQKKTCTYGWGRNTEFINIFLLQH
jgi:hypothetical protein